MLSRIAFAVCFLLVEFADAQVKLIEKVAKKEGEVIIPYEKYKLNNGLTVVIHEDHSDPLVHVDVTYHVGSAREEIGKSGFAHFFEHMMFQGSDNVGDDQHFKYVTEAGGTLNGSTSRDRTNYYETVPANQLERMLWLEADRMGYFLDAVTQKKFEIQRATVKNERGQNYDNKPYGLVGEVTAKHLYPAAHPYSWLTIGYVDDLNRVTLADLKNFFLQYYGPNNATLTVGGDVDPRHVIGWVEKYFGSIPAGPEVHDVKLPLPSVAGHRYVTLEDNYAKIPQLTITYPTVANYHEDMMALACLAQVLGQSKASVFYQELTKPKLALSAMAVSSLSELAGEFTIQVMPVSGHSLKEMYEKVNHAFTVFEKRGVTEDDLLKFKGAYEASLLNGLQSVAGKVSQLAAFETFCNNPNYLPELLKQVRKLTRDDVMRVYSKYIKGRGAVVVSVVPRGQLEGIVAAPNFKAEAVGEEKPSANAMLTYKKGKDSFDRSKMPPSGEPPVTRVPDYWRKDLPNGMKVIGVESRELPLVSMTIAFPGGHLMQAQDTARAGLSRMLAVMLNEDTQMRTAEQMQVELQKLGASITVSSSVDELIFTVSALKKNLVPTIALLEERIFKPRFTQEAFSRNQQQVVESLKIRKAQPAAIADDVFAKLNYGLDHIGGIDQSGTTTSVKSLSLKDVQELYDAIRTTNGTKVVIAGDLGQEEALKSLAFLTPLAARPVPLPPWKPAPGVSKTKIYLVDVPSAAQTEFRVGKVTGVKYDATGEFFKAGLMNYVLGGAFSSRYNMNLREDKGWTYGARSAAIGDKYTGLYLFSSSIKGNATDSALVEVLKEAERFRNEAMSAEELAFMKNSIAQREALRYETLAQKAGFVERILDYELPKGFVQEQNDIIKKMSANDIRDIAKRWLTLEAMNILLVGDKNSIAPGLKRLNYEIIEVGRNGIVLGPIQ